MTPEFIKERRFEMRCGQMIDRDYLRKGTLHRKFLKNRA